jgi:signal transduction histidine kinase
MADLRTNYEVSQKQIEVDLLNQQKRNQRSIMISLAIISILAMIIVSNLLRNNRQKKKAYEILNLQKQATEEQKTKAENALSELKSLQKKMIHSAKMASLGEVTAGIAHEIQNPLNFVTNFSELNVEILDEMRAVFIDKLEAADKVGANEIMDDLAENLKKINEHSKRADAIVKGMLQHSRSTTGEKKLTDINALVDDSLRLSYHGLRAKNKGLIINVKTDFDKSAGEVSVVPQDMSRVILNLCNNAFYAVNLKKQTADSDFQPTVLVTTKRSGEKIKISVKDNGNGIPQKILDKIFQPFFTTKPTGQGTGLGLSLSFDIVKFHDGELKAETEEGNFTDFTIELPVGY